LESIKIFELHHIFEYHLRMKSPKALALFIFIVSLLALAGAYGTELLWHWNPCTLCLWQRLPYVCTACLSVGVLWPNHRWERPLLYLILCIFLGSGCLAFYHVGIEQAWWHNAFHCTTDIPLFQSSKAFLDAIAQQDNRPSCNTPHYILGLSLASWNAMVSFGLVWIIYRYVQRLTITRRSLS